MGMMKSLMNKLSLLRQHGTATLMPSSRQDEDIVVAVRHLSKKFCRKLKRSMVYGIHDLARSMVGLEIDSSQLRHDEFWALQDVNFEVKRGEVLGIIGQNGSGKSTLLRVLTGIFPPDTGEILINGRVGSLIAVGAGFHPYMTGRENIALNGAILGMNRQQIREKFDEIVEFAEIGEFIDSAVSTYSSGMSVRLGFSIAIHADIDVLLADEILAVGDLGFMLKCYNKLGELRQKGISTLFVSHDLQAITNFANRVILLNKGQQEYVGENAGGLTLYKKHFANIFQSEGEIEKVCTGTDDFKVREITFHPPLEHQKMSIKNGENIEYTIHYEATKDFNDIFIDTILEVPLPGSYYFQGTNHSFGKTIDIPKGEGVLNVVIHNITLNNIGAYLNFNIWVEHRTKVALWWRKIPLYVEGNALSNGWSHFNVEYKLTP